MSNDEDVIQPNEAFEPIRKRVSIDVGALVQHGEVVYRIAQVLDFESVIGIAVETGRSVPLRIGELRTVSDANVANRSDNQDLAGIADEDWRIAERRFSAIKPLIDRYPVGRDEVERRAKEVGVDTATLYRWLQKYISYEVITALIPRKRGWKVSEP